jgi:hypothetical protein
MQVEISRLRRIEAKADSSIRQAIARRIQELQSSVQKAGQAAMAKKNAA